MINRNVFSIWSTNKMLGCTFPVPLQLGQVSRTSIFTSGLKR